MGERSIIPALGVTRRNGSMIGSVTRNSSWYRALPWSTGSQLISERAMIAQVRIWSHVNVSWATYG